MSDIKVQKCLIDYFTCLRNAYNSSKIVFTKCYKISSTIHTLVQRLSRIQRANVIDSPLEDFDELICKLTILLDKDINRHVKELQQNCEQMCNLCLAVHNSLNDTEVLPCIPVLSHVAVFFENLIFDLLYKDYDILNKKMINLDNICDDIDFRESNTLIDGSAFQPGLSELLEYSQDGSHFLHSVWSQLKFAIFCISSRDNCNYTQLLNESFKLNEPSDERIKHILMMTQFCNKTDL